MREILEAIAPLYDQHDSEIARDLGSLVRGSLDIAVTESPQQVDACFVLSEFQRGFSPLADLVLDKSDLLQWRLVVAGKLPAKFTDNMAAVELIGPTGMIKNDKARLGFFIQAPNLHYPSHWHPAEELYHVVQGRSGWAVDDLSLSDKNGGDFIHHLSMQPHTMETYDEPLLAIWGWTGELSADGYDWKRD